MSHPASRLHPPPSTPHPRPPHGGHRPGAGAPRGNLNGLKTGRHSRQVQALQLALRTLPLTADVLRRVEAAGYGRRLLLARALHHLAHLILLGTPETQSKNPAKIDKLQIPGPEKIHNSINQANGPATLGPTPDPEPPGSEACPQAKGSVVPRPIH